MGKVMSDQRLYRAGKWTAALAFLLLIVFALLRFALPPVVEVRFVDCHGIKVWEGLALYVVNLRAVRCRRLNVTTYDYVDGVGNRESGTRDDTNEMPSTWKSGAYECDLNEDGTVAVTWLVDQDAPLIVDGPGKTDVLRYRHRGVEHTIMLVVTPD
jgi:hypothetical protein